MPRRAASVTQADVAGSSERQSRLARLKSKSSWVSKPCWLGLRCPQGPKPRLHQRRRSSCDNRHAMAPAAVPASRAYPARQALLVCAPRTWAPDSIKAQFGTPEIDAAYKAAIDGQGQLPQPKMPVEAADSLAWLIARYRETMHG